MGFIKYDGRWIWLGVFIFIFWLDCIGHIFNFYSNIFFI
ncbi:hypothetical protein XOC_4058 [Xanthomonas oryzae pv. oryzicola BLS256]|uniref:Uncharacterized protein n=1 Tax=Xanthomonas oryzae pv. oryzicola (strain BLS256) TaxID=383407 RepID=G7TIN0_XANOB|nr:hypothetical protein XOC_4058 [Xanthomonas oryzae pv. oryzicola BLS256]QEO95662.1 hypothetical protein XOCgx_0668 [Xanthomonas oryzae pv. oryzicola]